MENRSELFTANQPSFTGQSEFIGQGSKEEMRRAWRQRQRTKERGSVE